MSIKSRKFNLGKMEVINDDIINREEYLSIKSKDKKVKAFVGISSAVLLGSIVVDNFTFKDNIIANSEVESVQNDNSKDKEDSKISKKIVEAKLLSAVSGSYDVKSVNNSLIYNVEKNNSVFSPISGTISSIENDSVIVENKELNIKMKVSNVNTSNLTLKDRIEEGNVLGKTSADNLNIELDFLDIEKEKEKLEVEYNLSIDEELSSNFNYLNEDLKGQDIVTYEPTNSEVASLVGKVDDSVKESEVLKGVILENKNQAAVLKSSDVYYINDKLPVSILKGGKANVSEEIRALEPVVREVFKDLKIEEFVECYLAILQHESGGKISNTGGDVAQASQSKNGKIGGITDVRESIEAGGQAFYRALEVTNAFDSYENAADARYIPQTYNFGNSLGKDVVSEDVIYNVAYVQEKAIEYRDEALKSGRELSDLGKREWRGDAMYGDFTYVAKFFNIFTPDNVNEKIKEAKATVSNESESISKVNIVDLKVTEDELVEDTKEVLKDATGVLNIVPVDSKILSDVVNESDSEVKYITNAVVENSKEFKVSFKNKDVSLSEINLYELDKKSANLILDELLISGNYKSVKNEMLEYLLKSLNNSDMDKFLTGNYGGKLLDTLVEFKDGIIGNRDLTKEEEFFIKTKTDGIYSVTTLDNETFLSDNIKAINYALTDDKERIASINTTYNSLTFEAPKDVNLSGLTIALDYGHALKSGSQGGVDIGASTIFKNGKNENKLTYEWGKEFKSVLESYGATVIEVSSDGAHNYSRGARGDFANNSGADMFFSIHFNAGGEGNHEVSGTEVVISTENNSIDRSLAETLLKNQYEALPDSHKRPLVQKEVGALLNADMKYGAVIVEPEFLVSIYGNLISENENAKKSVLNSWIKGIYDHVIENDFVPVDDSKETGV